MTIKSICDNCKKEVVKESYIHDHIEVEYLYKCEHCGQEVHWAYGSYWTYIKGKELENEQRN